MLRLFKGVKESMEEITNNTQDNMRVEMRKCQQINKRTEKLNN